MARRAIARAAYLRRLYARGIPLRHHCSLEGDGDLDRLGMAGGRRVLAATCAPDRLAPTALRLLACAAPGHLPDSRALLTTLELFVPVSAEADVDALVRPLAALRCDGAAPPRRHPPPLQYGKATARHDA